MAAKRAAKLRITLKKNRSAASRQNDLTRAHQRDALSDKQQQADERVSRKGDVTRRRTILGEQSGDQIVRAIDEAACRTGRVLRAIGSTQCLVQDTESGSILTCTVRKMLRTIASDARSAVVAGDRIRYLPVGERPGGDRTSRAPTGNADARTSVP
jgi:ribosome biogenesis GTPase